MTFDVSTDPRIAAYCSPSGLEVFSCVVHGNQIWTVDPFDAELIHREARETFDKLLTRASSPDIPPSGKTLLLLGEGGSGKTHLMRAFRAVTHANGDGYCAYLQLATKTDHYGRYILSKVLDSLELPYRNGRPETGLQRLARGLIDAIDLISADERQSLSDDILLPKEVASLVNRLSSLAVQIPRFQGIDINVIRAILYTLSNDAPIHAAIIQWLRCEDLNSYDRELIGGMVPRPQAEMAAATIHSLGRLVHAVHDAAFVVLVDEMEAYFDRSGVEEERAADIRSAINALVEIVDSVPNAIVVVSCLEDYYKKARGYLSNTKIDRLERDPDPIRLSSKLKLDEITELVKLRLNAFYEAFDIAPDPANPIAPYNRNEIAGLAEFRSRDILDNLRKHHQECMLAGSWVKPQWSSSNVPPPPPIQTSWQQRWNDHVARFSGIIAGDEPQLAELLTFAAQTISAELPSGNRFTAVRDDRFVSVEALGPDESIDKLLVAICDRSTRGGGLGNQIKQVAEKVGTRSAILVRSTDFPKDPKQVVAKEIAKIVAPVGKGRRVVVSDADWRALSAFRTFCQQHGKELGFADWQRADRPLSGLTAVQTIFSLEKRMLAGPVFGVEMPPAPRKVQPVITVPPASVQPPVAKQPTLFPDANTPIHIGRTRSSNPTAVDMSTTDFMRHAAFLGGSGSGKTTAALTVIEQLLMNGVPVVMLDRKGDLCRYADPDAWAEVEPDADRSQRRQLFHERVEAVVYTPGSEKGRPLRIPVVPDLTGFTSTDAEQIAQSAALGLTQIMRYNTKSPDCKTVILQKAIEVLARSQASAITVRALRELISDMDESLTNETEGYDAKHFKKLGTDLLSLSVLQRRLLEVGEPLSVDELLGRGSVTQRTRLSIINTQFLGDDNIVDFWVAQFLLCVDRWRAKSPSTDLQAVFFFDEADRYLPAIGKPATKAPMEGLLRRARSAGIGIFLATQSPGDFDYKCRDQVLNWFIGRVKEKVAIDKLKSMLDRRPDAVNKLAGQSAGEFYLVRENAISSIQVTRNLLPTKQLPEDRILAISQCER